MQFNGGILLLFDSKNMTEVSLGLPFIILVKILSLLKVRLPHLLIGIRIVSRDFPGSPVVKTSPSNAGGAGSIPGRGAKIPHASRPKNQNIKQKQYCNKFNKDFKSGPHEKKKIKKKERIVSMSQDYYEDYMK